MLLRRTGSKKRIAKQIETYFPDHTLYVELFFGCGGMFFSKRKAQYNIVNDLNDDVFNLFQVVTSHKDELIEIMQMIPTHESLLDYWKHNEETEPVKRAARFLFLSNYTLFGSSNSLRFGKKVVGTNLEPKIKKTYHALSGVQFTHCDFRDVLKKVEILKRDRRKTLVYADPPYLSTVNNYKTGSFTEKDSLDLFNVLEENGTRWAMSEFDHPFILDQAKQRGLNVIQLGERTNIKNKRNEILVTNYSNKTRLFY